MLMKLPLVPICLSLTLTAAILPLSQALPPVSAQPKQDAPGWKDLFNGKSLDGWKSTNFGGEGEVHIKGGVIVMERGDDMTGITYARGDFPKVDYEVTLEGKKVRGGDFFCTTTFPVGNTHCSLVVGGWGGTVVGLSTINGRDASENETNLVRNFKQDQWYRVRIRVTKDRITAWIDKEKVVDLDTRGKKISIRPECQPCRPFGVATWRTAGAVRNIRVRNLTAAEKAAPGKDNAEKAQVRVMSFNIRYGTAADGDNHWKLRKDFVVETIKAFGPDLLGTQETLGFQRDYLAAKLDGYASFGAGRDDGKERGEMAALFYKKARFEKLDGGHFWLSSTPDKPGSKGWDAALPRVVSWVKLRDRQSAKDQPIAFFNTHFDHRGAKARIESARLLRDKITELGKGCAIIVTGDFNAAEGSQPYQALFGTVQNQPSPIIDCHRAAHPKRQPNEGTFSGFRATATGGSRIDWIGASTDWKVMAAGIDRTSRNGATPSDHFPVTAVLGR